MTPVADSTTEERAHLAVPTPKWKVYLALTAAAFFWGSGFSAIRVALRAITPLELLAAASVFAAASQVAWSAARGNWGALRLPRSMFWPIVALALVSQNILNGLTNLGLASTTATNTALIYGFSPVFISLLASIFLGERFGPWKRLGATVGFAGLGLIITQGRLEAVQLRGALVGNLWILGGALYWAGYSVGARSLTQRIAPEAFTFYIIVLGAILPVILMWARGINFPFSRLDRPSLLAIIFVGVCTVTLAMNFWNWGLAQIEASRVGMFSYLEPVFAAAVAMTFLGERLTWPTAAGSVLVFTGIFLSTRVWAPARRN